MVKPTASRNAFNGEVGWPRGETLKTILVATLLLFAVVAGAPLVQANPPCPPEDPCPPPGGPLAPVYALACLLIEKLHLGYCAPIW